MVSPRRLDPAGGAGWTPLAAPAAVQPRLDENRPPLATGAAAVAIVIILMISLTVSQFMLPRGQSLETGFAGRSGTAPANGSTATTPALPRGRRKAAPPAGSGLRLAGAAPPPSGAAPGLR